jgi:hypothetical protein
MFFFRIPIIFFCWFIGSHSHLIVLEAKLCLSSRKISCLKLELDLIIRSLMVMILEVCARKSMVSFVMVSLNFLRDGDFVKLFSLFLIWCDLLWHFCSWWPSARLFCLWSWQAFFRHVNRGNGCYRWSAFLIYVFLMPTIIWFSAFIVFQIISEEVKSSNLIVLLKDVEKSFTEYTESHEPLRDELLVF